MLTQARQRPALVAPGGVADNVCSNNCRQFALLTGHGYFPALLHRILGPTNRVGNHMQAGLGAMTRSKLKQR
jgi:hypothetical protein